ncbi:MAG TPA: hypothetical protein VFS24_20450 [Steroidobacteraceae bacterium]|nr:hypothetical protein [Steroidobacteraceae bacterium]
MRWSNDVLRMPSSVKTASPDAARTLEQVWQRRRQELGNWQPSGGWLIEPAKTLRPNRLKAS